jgi:hypothetical protein
MIDMSKLDQATSILSELLKTNLPPEIDKKIVAAQEILLSIN